jgi:hypothetical protein
MHRNPPVTPGVWFNSLSVVDKTPKNECVGDREFIMVVYMGKPMWALFRCPCGCGQVISLSLQSIHHPNWKINKSSTGRPTLYPSVSQNKGCRSHFWVEDGRVHWCGKKYHGHQNDLRMGISMKSAAHSHLSPVDLEHHLENSSKIVYKLGY